MLFYSTNPRIKLIIQRQWAGDTHYVWCSKYFDSSKAPSNTLAQYTGVTSDPSRLYAEWTQIWRSKDRHSERLSTMKASLVARAEKWFVSGAITEEDRDDIRVMVESADHDMFRPVLYVIPSGPIHESRIKRVPMAKRASFGEEYIIADLRGTEFDPIEVQ